MRAAAINDCPQIRAAEGAGVGNQLVSRDAYISREPSIDLSRALSDTAGGRVRLRDSHVLPAALTLLSNRRLRWCART
jgi:hypothetical protein